MISTLELDQQFGEKKDSTRDLPFKVRRSAKSLCLKRPSQPKLKIDETIALGLRKEGGYLAVPQSISDDIMNFSKQKSNMPTKNPCLAINQNAMTRVNKSASTNTFTLKRFSNFLNEAKNQGNNESESNRPTNCSPLRSQREDVQEKFMNTKIFNLSQETGSMNLLRKRQKSVDIQRRKTSQMSHRKQSEEEGTKPAHSSNYTQYHDNNKVPMPPFEDFVLRSTSINRKPINSEREYSILDFKKRDHERNSLPLVTEPNLTRVQTEETIIRCGRLASETDEEEIEGFKQRKSSRSMHLQKHTIEIYKKCLISKNKPIVQSQPFGIISGKAMVLNKNIHIALDKGKESKKDDEFIKKEIYDGIDNIRKILNKNFGRKETL